MDSSVSEVPADEKREFRTPGYSSQVKMQHKQPGEDATQGQGPQNNRVLNLPYFQSYSNLQTRLML